MLSQYVARNEEVKTLLTISTLFDVNRLDQHLHQMTNQNGVQVSVAIDH